MRLRYYGKRECTRRCLIADKRLLPRKRQGLSFALRSGGATQTAWRALRQRRHTETQHQDQANLQEQQSESTDSSVVSGRT